MNPSPVFILGAHKSGTSLLRALLDGHSELGVLPFESHFMALLGREVTYSYRKQSAHSDADFRLGLAALLRQYAVSDDRTADALIGAQFDLNSAQNDCLQLDPIEDIKGALTALEHIMTVHFPQAGTGRLVEKSVEHHEFATDIAQAIPHAKFIHIVRNPYANAVGLRKFKSQRRGYPYFKKVIDSIESSMACSEQLLGLLQRNYLLVRYEDLVQEPRKIMKQVAFHINIPWEDKLLQPTSLGQPWGGNSSYGQSTAIDPSRLDSWRDEICDFERIAISHHLFPTAESFAYTKEHKQGGFLNRAPNEPWLRYLINRAQCF